MNRSSLILKWLRYFPLKGRQAFSCALIAIVMPALIRLAVPGGLAGSTYIPYVPFLILAAITLDWKLAAVVAVASVALGDLIVFGPAKEHLSGTNEGIAILLFFLSSALIIGLAKLTRSAVEQAFRISDVKVAKSGIIFSRERGEAWASWQGADLPMRLGPHEEVAEMMEDFLAQVEIGERLERAAGRRR